MTGTAESPAVTVVIPAYNAAWCVGRAIDSVLAQDFRNYEVIAVNDGSTDDTSEALHTYQDTIRVITQPNMGLPSARNTGIEAARGDLIAFLDADDWWMPAKLTRQVDLMRARPELGFTSTAARVEDPQGRLVNMWTCPHWTGAFLTHLFRQPAAVAGSGSAVVARRALFDRVGMFDQTLHSLEDIDMWIRLSAASGYACIDEALAVIVKRPDSMSRNLNVMNEAAIKVMNKNRQLLPSELRGAYWRYCVAGIHADYAKWRYRRGDYWGAVANIARALLLAPFGRGRLGLGLLKDMLLGRSI